MIDMILTDLSVQIILILFSLIGTLVLTVYRNHQHIKKIKQRLFGLERDESDSGHIQETHTKIKEVDQKVDNLEDDVENISVALKRIEDKIDFKNSAAQISLKSNQAKINDDDENEDI